MVPSSLYSGASRCGRIISRRTRPGSIDRPDTNIYTRLKARLQYRARWSVQMASTGSKPCKENLRTTSDNRLFFGGVDAYAPKASIRAGG